MEALRKEEIYTIEDIYDLPDGERAELIDGQIYYMAPPTWKHQRISMFLSSEISSYIKNNKGNCEVLAAPFAVFLNKDDSNYFEPDISVICDRSKLDEKGCHGAPDWLIEIVSPSSKTMDYFRKCSLYKAAGVREYWIIDPKEKCVIVNNFENGTSKQYPFSEQIKAGIYEDFFLDFNEVA